MNKTFHTARQDKMLLFFLLSIRYISRWLEKRTRALRGRNPTRDTQPDGAPMVHQAPWWFMPPGASSSPPLDTRAMP